MSKQTAVEWLTNELKNELGYGADLGKSDQIVLDKIINQANEIFEKQIQNAYLCGQDDEYWNTSNNKSSVQYYNETFNK